jgi:hypothetical protein
MGTLSTSCAHPEVAVDDRAQASRWVNTPNGYCWAWPAVCKECGEAFLVERTDRPEWTRRGDPDGRFRKVA